MIIKITIPEGNESGYKNAFADAYGYQDNIEVGDTMIPNPESKKEFMKRKILEYANNIYISWQAKQSESTRKTLVDTATTFVSTTTVEG